MSSTSLPELDCPYCGATYVALAVASDGKSPIDQALAQSAMAPFVCEGCAQVGLMYEGKLYRLSKRQLDAVQHSPAWKMIAPAVQELRSRRKLQ